MLIFPAFSQTTAGVTVEVDDEINFRTAPNFSSSAYVSEVLKKPQRMKLLGTKKMRRGYGLKVMIEGDNSKDSRVGWVYASSSSNTRLLSFFKDGQKLDLGSGSEFIGNIKELEEGISDQNRLLDNASATVEKEAESIDSVWRNIYDGKYIIDIESDDGSEFFPVLKKTLAADGSIHVETIQVRRNYTRLLEIPEHLDSGINYANSCVEDGFKVANLYDFEDEHEQEIEGEEKIASSETSESCLLLSKAPSSWNVNDMKKCLTNLSKKVNPYAKVSQTLSNRKKVFQNLFSLSPAEQDFMGAIMTGCGEVSKSSPEEVFLVFKSLQNRKRIAQEQKVPAKRTYYKSQGKRKSKVVSWSSDSCKEATLLDVAVQPKQYSMWNKNASHWARCLNGKGNGYGSMFDKMLNAYKDLKSGENEVKGNVSKITHYHTRTIKPYWNKQPQRDSIPNIKVNGKNIGSKGSSHHYFLNVEQAGFLFKYHPYREQQEAKEKSCY